MRLPWAACVGRKLLKGGGDDARRSPASRPARGAAPETQRLTRLATSRWLTGSAGEPGSGGEVCTVEVLFGPRLLVGRPRSVDDPAQVLGLTPQAAKVVGAGDFGHLARLPRLVDLDP